MKKEHRNTRFPLLLFLCTEQFTYTSLLTLFAGQRSSLLLNMQNVHYYLLLHLFASLCPHTVIWCSQILNKTVFIVIFYCFCCQTSKLIWNSDWNATHWDYITSSPFQDVNLHKNPDLKSSCRLIKSNTHKIKTIAVLWFRLLLHVKLEKQHNIWFN